MSQVTRAISLIALLVYAGAGTNSFDRDYAVVAHRVARAAFARLSPRHRGMIARAAADPHRIPIFCCLEGGDEPDMNLANVVNAVLSGGTAFQATYRWSSTATNPTTGPTGAPITLRYSFMPDGTVISGGLGEPTAPSNLFATLNASFGSPAAWQAHFASVFARWTAVSGVTYVFEPNDDGSATFAGLPGVTGVRGDVRIGGHYIDGTTGSNVLAYSSFPNFGDIVFDTGNTAYFGSLWSNAINLRNTASHEAGHGLGLAHVCPANGTKLLEPFINTGFDGPAHDDIRGAHKNYGDRFEDNDVAATATDLGALANGTLSLIDLSCDNGADVDWFRIDLNATKTMAVTVTPIGSTYLEGAQAGTCSAGVAVNSLAATDLAMSIHDQNGAVLTTMNANGAGAPETIPAFSLPASPAGWFVRVFGGPSSTVQMYRLDITITEGTSAMLAFFGVPGEKLGAAVANAGDVDNDGKDDVVAGAPSADGGSADAGRAVVYSGATGGVLWSFVGAAAGDQLGSAVAGAGDVDADGFDDVLVGAPGSDAGGVDGGRAIVYSGANGVVLLAINGAAGDQLGCAVAAAGDVSGDGKSDIIVGARWADPSGTNSGRVRLHSGATGVILRTWNGGAANDELGAAVGAAGDVDGDGVGDVVAGAPLANAAGPDSGQVHVWSGATGALLYSWNGITAGEMFGAAVAGAGDVNADGRGDVIAGAPNANMAAGRIVVCSGLTGLTLISAAGVASGDQLGCAVGGGSDVDDDGFDDVVAGMRAADPGGSSSGGVLILLGPYGMVTGAIPGIASGEQAGSAVGGGGDLGADGFGDLIVGAPESDAGGVDSGTVRVFRFPNAVGTNLGSGCGPSAPMLSLTSPALGAVATLQVSGTASNVIGSLLGSPAGAPGIPLGGGCTSYLELGAVLQMTAFTTNGAGSWTAVLVVPTIPYLSGLELVLQAFTYDPQGIAITNAINVRLGY